jgi:metal transporter CNNM
LDASDNTINDMHKATQTQNNLTPSFDSPVLSSSPKTAMLMMRRSSAGVDGQFVKTAVPVRANFEDIKLHLKHLGPSNPATNPKKTQSTTVKVKPGTGTHSAPPRSASLAEPLVEELPAEEGDETTSLLRPRMTPKDGIQVLRQQQRYGSVSPAVTVQLAPPRNGVPTFVLDEAVDQVDKSTQTLAKAGQPDLASPSMETVGQQTRGASSSGESTVSITKTETNTTLIAQRPYVRSGSITENVIESRGVRKVVLETSSSNDDEELAIAAASSSPEQLPKLLGRTTFNLFNRDNGNASAKDQGSKEDLSSQAIEEEEEDLLSPDEEAPGGSAAESNSKGASQAGDSGAGGGKKKNRRKKRKGGKS